MINTEDKVIIKVSSLKKSFDETDVLKGIDLNINRGDVVCVIGASGSGKSTLLRCMNLLEVPTGGEVWMGENLLTPVDVYSHDELVALSLTAKNLVSLGLSENEAAQKIKNEKLLGKKEGKEFKEAVKAYEAEKVGADAEARARRAEEKAEAEKAEEGEDK